MINTSYLNYKEIFQSFPCIGMLISVDMPDFTIIDVTIKLLNATDKQRKNVIGKKLFEVYPDNPDTGTIGAVSLRASLEKVIATKKMHQMGVQRYDVKKSNGKFEEDYWQPTNTPVLDDNGNIQYIIHVSENVTEKILHEREAKTVQQNFEFYFNNAFTPFAIFSGEDFVFTFANDAYVELIGRRELIGKPLLEAVPEIIDQPFIHLLNNVFKTGEPYHTSAIAATANYNGDTESTTRYFNLSYIPYKNESGNIVGILASGYDVTEEVELKIKEEKNILNMQVYSLFMQAPVGFSLLRGDDNIVELANETGLKITGKQKDIIGKPVKEIFPNEDIDYYLELLDNVKKTGISVHLNETPVTLYINGKPESLYFNLVYQPYYEGDKIVGVLNISTDVTEHVLARKKIESAEQTARVAIESADLGVYEIDLINNSINADKRFYTLFGFEHPVLWADLASLLHPEDLPIRNNAYETAMLTGSLLYEARIIHPNKSLHWIRVFGKIFRDETDKPFKLLGVVQDITEQKKLEKQKDNFISMASHELKTPVTTIKAYAQIIENILEKKDDNNILPMIKRMTHQVNKLTNLIEDLLDFTKIQKGKLLYQEGFFNFNELTIEVIDDMQKTTFTHTIQHNLQGNAIVFGDREKLSQVIINLMSNAIKYSPNADKIIVNTGMENDTIILSVEDFGIGIAETEQPKVFEQFYRVAGDKQSTFPGMGIGLFICAEVIASHYGKIWVESRPGKGSVFYASIPTDHRKG